MPDPIDLVLRSSEPKPLGLGEGDQLFVIDLRSRKLIKPGFLTGMRRSVAYYIVNCTYQALRCDLPIELTMIVAHDVQRVQLLINYETSCIGGKEEGLLDFVQAHPSPQRAVDAFVEAKVREFVRAQDPATFIDQFAAMHPHMQQHVVDAARELGLSLHLAARPAIESLRPINIPPTTIGIRPRDADIRMEIVFEGDLIVDSQRQQVACIRDGDSATLKNKILQEAETFLRSQGLQELYRGLGTTVEHAFSQRVAALLAEKGRVLSSPAFRCDFASQSPYLRSIRATHEGSIRFIHDNPSHPSPLEVRASYNLTLENAAKFVNHRVLDLDEWAKSVIVHESKDLLFEVSHDELCNKFTEAKRQLHIRVERAAANIGYRLRQFTAITDHQLDELVRGIDIAPLEGSYVLRSPEQMRGRLSIALHLRLRDISKVVERVARNETIAEQIKKLVDHIVATCLRRVSPEEFYVCFDLPTPVLRDGSSGPSVREMLTTEICARLERDYDAEVQLDFMQLETEVHQRYLRLIGEVHVATVQVQPPGETTLEFQFEYRVRRVHEDGWPMFLRTEAEAHKVSEMLCREISLKLAASTVASMMVERSRLFAFVARVAQQRAYKDFGLVIEIENLVRLSTTEEQERTRFGQESRLAEIERWRRERDAGQDAGALDRQGRINQIEQLWRRAEDYEELAKAAWADDNKKEAKRFEKRAVKCRQDAADLRHALEERGLDSITRSSRSFGGQGSIFGPLPKAQDDPLRLVEPEAGAALGPASDDELSELFGAIQRDSSS